MTTHDTRSENEREGKRSKNIIKNDNQFLRIPGIIGKNCVKRM